MTYAGFWKRFLAVVVDWVLMLAVLGPIAFLMFPGGMQSFLDPEGAGMGALNALSILGGWIYYAAMESSKFQATVGKMAVGIKVTGLNGERLSFVRATIRHFAKIISAVILMIGFLMAAFTEKKQGLHDILASTLVVRK